MKRFWHFGVGFLVVAALLVAACAPVAAPAPSPAPAPAAKLSPEEAAWQEVVKAAQKEGRLIIYSASYFAGDVGRAVAKAFKERYGINVEFLVTGGSAATIEKLLAEKRAGVKVASLMASGSVSGPRALEVVSSEKIAPQLPILKDRSVFAMDPAYSPGGELITFQYTLLTPAVNSNLVKPEEVQSFQDMLKPKFKGKIIMRDPRLGSGPEMLGTTQFRYEKILDDEYFTRLGQHEPLLFGVGSIEVAKMVARGEGLIAFLGSTTSTLGPVVKEGAPLEVLHMKEGSIGMPSMLQLMKDAPHPNAARVFLNWILSEEGQIVYHKAEASPSLRKGSPDYSPAAMKKHPVKKLLPTTWDISLKTIAEVRAGTMEKFYGPTGRIRR